MQNSQKKDGNKSNGKKKGFSLPTTSSKPPMPPVKQPKKKNNK